MKKKISVIIVIISLIITMMLNINAISQDSNADAPIEISEGDTHSFKVQVEESGLYHIQIEYKAHAGKNHDIEISMKLNGEYPNPGARLISLGKIYEDELPVKRDNRGNDIRPQSKEILEYQKVFLRDYMGYESIPYLFEIPAGENKIELEILKGGMSVKEIQTKRQETFPTYDEYRKEYSGEPVTKNIQELILAQAPNRKSSSTIYSITDKSSASLTPPARGKFILNAFGGRNFAYPKQWVEYEFNLPESGLYRINIKYKQNIANGITSFRKIYINGKVEFDELNAVAFNYGSDWQNKILGDENTYEIYLEQGVNTIRLEVVLGPYSEIVQGLTDSVRELNFAYRQSILYLTATPDIYRDYNVKENLVDVLDIFKSQSKKLTELSEMIFKITNEKNERTAFLDRFAYQLNDLVENPETLPRRLDQFKNNISATGAMINIMSFQPLMIDTLFIHTKDVQVPDAGVGIVSNIWNEIINFMVTFQSDYMSIGDIYTGSDNIEVWITTGRDQANSLKSLIDTQFSPLNAIGVNLELVQPAMILPAVVAGIGPDVALQVGNSEPVNFALRGAIYDLNLFDDTEEVLPRFSESSVVPLRFGEHLYGLPETESFLMMFYRSDILEELSIPVPQTWMEAVVAITELQKNNLMIGLPQAPPPGIIAPIQGPTAYTFTYGMLLNQFGGSIYREDNYYTALDSEESIRAFVFLTDLYSNYKLPIQYDILTRFRIGEMPIAIADYTLYNLLQVGAPEIRGLWDFTLVPGVEQTDGSINRSVLNTGQACMILANSSSPESAWKFLKWWTSADIQLNYGSEMENILGPSARVPTANIEAMRNLPWTRKNLELIERQREWVVGYENVPGGYFTPRHIDNAFRKVVIGLEEPRETLLDYVRIINKEIESKALELDISIDREVGK